MFSTLPNELLLLLFSRLDAQTACRLSQSSRSWQLWLLQNKLVCRFAWLHHRALLSWAERAQIRVKHRRGHVRGRVPWVLSSFVRVPAPAPQMFSAAHVERLFSPSVGVRLRCCFFSVDDPKSNCCGAMISMRNVECLWAHLKTAHGVDEAAYMQRARALGWLCRPLIYDRHSC